MGSGGVGWFQGGLGGFRGGWRGSGGVGEVQGGLGGFRGLVRFGRLRGSLGMFWRILGEIFWEKKGTREEHGITSSQGLEVCSALSRFRD